MFKDYMREELYNYAHNQLETIKEETVNIINENVQLFKEISEPSKEELKKYRKKAIETSSNTAPLLYVINDEELQSNLF
jgi:formiminotetrahydrofolate cyclodeaminase